MAASSSANKNEEVDLFELTSQLWSSKSIIIGIAIAFTIIGVSYLFITPKIYQSNAVITPPAESSLSELQNAELLLKKVNQQVAPNINNSIPDKIFVGFVHNLNSNRYKATYLRKPEVKEYFQKKSMSQLQARQAFDDSFQINIPKQQPYAEIHLSLQTQSAELSSRLLNEYIEYAHNRYISEVAQNLNAQVHSIRKGMELTIESLNSNYRSTLKEEIKKLEEALMIAEEIGLSEPLHSETLFYSPQVIDQIRSLYRLGTKSIKAELNALSSRLKNKDSVPGLSEYKFKLKLLSNISLNPQSISAMTVDLPAEVNPKPVKPRRLLIIAACLVTGSIIGILTVLILNSLSRRQKTIN